MTNTDQIIQALQHIAAHGGDLPLETDLALKALAADYERQRKEIERLQSLTATLLTQKGILESICAERREEIERLKRKIGELRHLLESAIESVDILLGPESPLPISGKGVVQGAFIHLLADGKVTTWQLAARQGLKNLSSFAQPSWV